MTDAYRGLKRGALMFGLLVIVAALFGFLAFEISSHEGQKHLVQSHGNPVGGSFKVVTLVGSTATDSDYLGHWFLVWFVDPRCPQKLCAGQLRQLDQALMRLKQERHPIVPVIVSLDFSAPDTDDLEDYFKEASPDISPFYATENMIRAMTKLYHAPLVKEQGGYYAPALNYVLMDPQGRYAASVPAALQADALYERLGQIMNVSGKH